MEADKFEKHIKSKLDSREITPSAKAWQTISKELESQPTAKKSGYFWWGVAASVAVIIGVAVFYITSEEETRSAIPILVQQPISVPIENEEELISLDVNKNINGLVLEDDAVQDDEVEKQEVVAFTTNRKQDVIEQANENTVVFENVQEKSKVNDIQTRLSESVLNDKIADVVAQVEQLELSAEVSDAEVDSLLRNAQEAIFREQLFKPHQSVDAMALLTQVEEELDQSFRDQIFQSLKSGFLKVRTAVADRNN